MAKRRPTTKPRITCLATCVLSWEGDERRTARYGAIRCDELTYDGGKAGLFEVHAAAIESMAGKRVLLTAEVVEHRPSGHLGDNILHIKPNPQPKGTVVDLGIGILRDLGLGKDGVRQIALEPEESRDCFWINPHRLYELHDQTVRLCAEPTKAAAPEPYKELKPVNDIMVMNGDGQTYQVRTRRKEALMPSPQIDIVARPALGLLEITQRQQRLKPGDRVKLVGRAETVKTLAKEMQSSFARASGGA